MTLAVALVIVAFALLYVAVVVEEHRHQEVTSKRKR